MSLKYVEQRIKEALKLSGGNQVHARKQILSWLDEDAELLRSITRNHMSGIIAYHVERVASGRNAKPEQPVPETPKSNLPEGAGFGEALLEAVSDADAAVFGLEGYSNAPRKKGQASKRHVDAIRLIASKNKQ